jgi:hypothetical protein
MERRINMDPNTPLRTTGFKITEILSMQSGAIAIEIHFPLSFKFY